MRINPDQPAGESRGGSSEIPRSTAELRPGKQRSGVDLQALLDLVESMPRAVDGDSSMAQHATFSKRDGSVGKVVKAHQFAQQQGIELTPRDFARALGEAPEPPILRLGQTVKDRLPVLTSRSEKLNQLGKEMRRVVQEAKKDQFTCKELSTWFSSLSPEDRAQVTVVPLFDGVGSWMQPLAIRVGHDTSKMFNAGHVPVLPKEVVAALPADQQTWLRTRRETLRSLGIDTGPQAQRFFQQHFEMTPVDVDGELQFELAKLCELEPALAGRLRSLQQHGVSLYFIKAKLTPEPVLDAVRDLAKSQRAFVSHWLRGLVEDGKMPTLTVDDYNRIAETHARTLRKANKHSKEGGLEAQLIDAELAEDLRGKLDFVGAAKLIHQYSNTAIGIALTGGGPQQHAELEEINAVIHAYLGGEWAHHRVGFDDSRRVGEDVRETFKALMAVSPIAEIVQRVLGLSGAAAFIAGSSDNVLAEKGELQTLAAAGVPAADIRKRAAFLGLFVIPADFELATHIDNIARAFGPHIAGSAFSLSAVMLPLFTIPFSIQYFANQFRKLGREGKLPDGTTLSDDERSALDKLASKDWLIESISKTLEKQNVEPAARAEIIAALQEMELPPIEKHPEANRQDVSRGRALAHGAKEVMVVNQLQLGLLAAVLGSIAVGGIFGPEILGDATREAVAGAFEVPLAMASLPIVNAVQRGNFKRKVENLQPLGLLGPGPTDAGSAPAMA